MALSDRSCVPPGLPAVDERLVAPGTRYEIHDGELVHVSPADPPHATRHLQIAALIEAHTGPEFEAAADLLTRTSEIDDLAPDVSVYPDAPAATGGRQIEELAFEIVSTQSLGHAGRKAKKLVDRGVRRVFAIDIERSRALEWSRALDSWRVLDDAEHLADRALAVALPIEALIRSAKADDAVARALLEKRNPVLESARAQDRAEAKQDGLAEGLAEGFARGTGETLIAMLDARGIALDLTDRERIRRERDPATLARWVARAATCADRTALFAVPADPAP
jgi:Uma2 family endonuclease